MPDAERAATLAALAVRITRATGLYRGTGHTAIPFMTFGTVTIAGNDGATNVIEIDVC